jgi:hypothetical protein
MKIFGTDAQTIQDLKLRRLSPWQVSQYDQLIRSKEKEKSWMLCKKLLTKNSKKDDIFSQKR